MNLENVLYFEDEDFNDKGELRHPKLRKAPVIIMISSTQCGFCKQVKPVYQKVVNEMKNNATFGIIVLDGKTGGERQLGERVSQFIPNFKGVPEFVMYKNGKYQKTYVGDRKKDSLIEFSKS